jgi:hypothetical protein
MMGGTCWLRLRLGKERRLPVWTMRRVSASDTQGKDDFLPSSFPDSPFPDSHFI